MKINYSRMNFINFLISVVQFTSYSLSFNLINFNAPHLSLTLKLNYLIRNSPPFLPVILAIFKPVSQDPPYRYTFFLIFIFLSTKDAKIKYS